MAMARARPVWLPTLAAVVFAALTATLGQWQWGKAVMKAAKQAVYDEGERLPVLTWQEATALGEAAFYRRVRVSGHFLPAYQVLLDNRVQEGRAGYHVIVPLSQEQGGVILVNRGWVEAAADRRQLPTVGIPTSTQTLEGILVHAQGHYLELAKGAEAGKVWQNLDLERYRAWVGADAALPDWLLLQTSPGQDGLVRVWPKPDLGIAMHRSYAVQWFSLCALIVGLWVYFVVVKRKVS
jgi:surfeit locus 1 family protein